MKPNSPIAARRSSRAATGARASMMSHKMLIEYWPIDRPKPYPKNARRWNSEAVDKVASSIQEYGFRQPIVVDRAGVIIVGTVRYLASKKLGLESFPVHVAEGLSPAQVQGYRIGDNRSHEETDWELDIVKLEINELDALKFDLKFTGFEPRELDESPFTHSTVVQ